jgi:hypothetical protein
MRPYTVNRPRFEHDNQHIPEGGIVELSDAAATPLLAIGAITEAPADAKATSAAAQASIDASDASDAKPATGKKPAK